jgi:radical SAM protein with 4Fe4S-binding SPASM domain
LENLLNAEEFEALFGRLHQISQRASFHIKTTEAQHYRRYILQQQVAARKGNALAAQRSPAKVDDTIGRAPRGLNDGKGFVFISHTGEVLPSGFLPISGGNVRRQSLSSIYRESALFQRLRNPDRLGGKCGACEFRHICGGSRARAYALTGDPMAEEPCCSYVPKGYTHPAAQPVNAASGSSLSV